MACNHGAAATCRGKFFVPFGVGLGISSHKPKVLTTSLKVSIGNVPPLGMKRYPLPLIAFKKILVSTLNNWSVVFNVGIVRGSFGHFYTLSGFSRHFMSIIQILTTCTCSSAYKLIEKTNMCPWLHA